jgi:hypothetical protein
MNRMLVWSLVGALIGGGTGAAIAVAGDDEGEIFIASDQPINADQVREKLTSDGWMNIQVAEQGRYFEATGTKAARPKKILVDSLTGRLIEGDDDD